MSAAKKNRFQPHPSVRPAVERLDDRILPSVTSPDFNGDGYGDLAIGAPYEDTGSASNAGGVNVIYGSSSGLTSAGNQYWDQASPDIEDRVEEGDNFGFALAWGDFNKDGYDDLAVGAPGEEINGIWGAGAVNVIYGSRIGLIPTNDQFWHQDNDGATSNAEVGDSFGSSLAVGDFNKDGYQDLAIGVRGEDVGEAIDGGAVVVLHGGRNGLTATNSQYWVQSSPGIGSSSEQGDYFGDSLAVGDFNRDGYQDLAIGVPFEDVGEVVDAGAVTVIYGGSSGLSSNGSQYWHQSSAGIQSSAEAGDRFGSALAAGDFNRDGYADLAVGVPGEDVGNIVDAGAVTVIYGGSGKLSSGGSQYWNQNSDGVHDTAEAGDYFGSALAVGDFNSDGYIDLAIGVPGESLYGFAGAGAVNVLFARSGGLSSREQMFVGRESRGAAAAHDNLGSALSVGDFNGDGYADLAVGVPGDDIDGIENAGSVNVMYGGPVGWPALKAQIWHQNSPGIFGDADPGDHFGRRHP